MSDTSPNLSLPYIAPNQAQKHVTHNEAIRMLDALVQAQIVSIGATTPPADPADGECHVPAQGATGAWLGQGDMLACWQDGAWAFLVPRAGWRVYRLSEGETYVYDGSAWDLAPLRTRQAGVNADADTTNRFALASPASLFSHEGAGHQMKVNKASEGDTASLLYQTDWSGRAEMGLTGDDDFHIKVSADGAGWVDAMVIDAQTGRARFPAGGVREVLDANRTYFVRSDGDDGNDGMTDSAAGAFATPQAAVQAAQALDCNGFNVTIQLGDGIYSGGIAIWRPLLGVNNFTILGNPSAPENVTVEGDPIAVRAYAGAVTLKWFGMRSTGSWGHGLHAQYGAVVTLTEPVFLDCVDCHICAGLGAFVALQSDYQIRGDAKRHCWALDTGQINLVNGDATLYSGAVSFPSGFVEVSNMAMVRGWNWSYAFDGGVPWAVTGKHYAVSYNGILNTGGGGSTYYPGDTAGTVATGGQYA